MGHTNCQKSRSRDWGFLAYFVPFGPSDFGLVHAPLSSLFRFFLYREMEGGSEGFIFSMEVAYVSNDLDFFRRFEIWGFEV